MLEVRKSIKITERAHENVIALCKKQERSFNWVVNKILENAVDNAVDNEKENVTTIHKS